MQITLTGKIALVTGATSGIGRATALRFAEMGANLSITGRNEKALQDLQKEIRRMGRKCLALAGDLTSQSFREELINKIVAEFGKLDILVNAAGVIATGSIETTSLADFDEMYDINVRTVFHLMQLATPHLIATKGNIVNVSSVTGIRAFPNVLAYGVSKAAVDQLTRSAALELASKGVRVNAVNPGVVLTNLHRRGGMSEEAYQHFLEHSKTTHPLGRVGQPEEVADLIAFLASDRAAWITGVTYSIDGGRSQTCFR